MAGTIARTVRLELRPLLTDDLEELVAIYADPDFNRALHSDEAPGLLEMAHLVEWQQELQESLGFSQWAIIESGSGELVGDCGFFPYEWQGPQVELAYHIRRDCWGRGYASEAALAAVQYARRQITRTVLAVTTPDNLASQRVLQRVGLKPLGERICYGTPMLAFELPPR